ncbi:MAG: GNAT family N-acetyltransferase [Brumimicrobium sp.]|nr:GNAT family N-acetyltransferase [Brumimicrobium sp.]
MSKEIILKEVNTLEEMLESYPLLCILYPNNFSKNDYQEMLQRMIPHNYTQLIALHNERVVGVCGVWLGTKIWCGKYLEMDNVVVGRDYRSHGIGKMFTRYLEDKARRENCNMMAADVYTDNFRAHKFYINEGFIPRGFHFLKLLNQEIELSAKD